jgi:hypothetical protein
VYFYSYARCKIRHSGIRCSHKSKPKQRSSLNMACIQRNYNIFRKDLLYANNPLYFSRSFKNRTQEGSSWRRTRLKQTGLSVLACEERFGLSGLTDHGALSSPLHRTAFTTSDHISIPRSLALLSIGRSHCAICIILVVCQEQILQRPSLSCPGKKAVSNNLQLPCRPTTMPASPIALTIFLEPPVS